MWLEKKKEKEIEKWPKWVDLLAVRAGTFRLRRRSPEEEDAVVDAHLRAEADVVAPNLNQSSSFHCFTSVTSQ